ncbi:MAG: FAD-binding oxidoreductase [Pseudonocardiales bacterium]|nr:FAD-binding oxidoreductase [Pseudonocardiales bacterium]
MDTEVLVIGAGVSGLTTAVCLAEADHRVAVHTDRLPAQTTSAVAGAMIATVGEGDPGPIARGAATLAEMTALAEQPGTGVRITTGTFAARPAFPSAPPGADVLPGFQMCDPAELPDGFGMGFRGSVPLVDMPHYLAYLQGRLSAAGGTMRVAPVGSLAHAAELAPLVVNCAGLGARELAGDSDLHGVRGQHVLVRNPGLTEFFLEAPLGPTWAGVFPHGEHVVLGGIFDPDDHRAEPDPAIADAILRACTEVVPELADAEVIGHQVGFRPVRRTVRLEAEQLGAATVVHNYGHGGNGVTLSWGCAREVLALLAG